MSLENNMHIDYPAIVESELQLMEQIHNKSAYIILSKDNINSMVEQITQRLLNKQTIKQSTVVVLDSLSMFNDGCICVDLEHNQLTRNNP